MLIIMEMYQLAHFHDFLMPTVTLDQIHTFSCGHIVPKENIMTVFLDKDSNHSPIRIDYERRDKTEMVTNFNQTA